jgi:hypothetical protein
MTTYAFAFSLTPETYQAYWTKLLNFGALNARSALQFGQDLLIARSPSDVADALVDYTRRQFENWTEQLEEFEVAAEEPKGRKIEVLGLGD